VRFERADLSFAQLTGALLPGAALSAVSLRFADLTDARLPYATLTWADCAGAVMRRTLLEGADLAFARLDGATLEGARLHLAMLQRTGLGGCADLHRAEGLDAVRHLGPSALDLATLRAGPLPLEFLRGAGLTEAEIVAVSR
jgi:uncharacterized protein YjbI with pentapeptide repeats